MRKIKTLLVDDDYLVLQDLEKMVEWDSVGFQIIDTAANGKRALEISQKNIPDLIVSDISMPVMDGFDFIEALKELNPRVYIIFISSYASFDYARRALQNHIHSYILKNEMTAESLIKELLQAKKLILQNESLHKEENEAELKKYFGIKSGHPALDQELLHRRFVLFFIASHMPLQKLKLHFQDSPEIGKQLYKEFQPLINEIYPDAYVFSQEEFVIAAIPWESLGKPFSCTSVSISCRSLQSKLQKTQEENVQIYTIPEKLSVPDGRNAFYHLLPWLHFFNSFPSYAKWDMSAYMEKEFSGIRQSFPYDCLEKSLEHPEIFVKELKGYTAALFKAMDADGIFMLYHNLLLQLEELSGHMVPINGRNLFTNEEAFTDFFVSVYKDIRQHLSRKGQAGYAPWLTAAINYMKNNYANSSMTVEQIAETAGLSTSRFSVLFRQETGQTVNDYLTEIRISQAVFLLENSNCKIYEIADKVGYKSAQYFSQIFSQKTGYKPLHFRKKKN
ncbi:MAG: response regulator [Eubacteriales bacterium]|nr:response regulator [Eubacteriales bacterium]